MIFFWCFLLCHIYHYYHYASAANLIDLLKLFVISSFDKHKPFIRQHIRLGLIRLQGCIKSPQPVLCRKIAEHQRFVISDIMYTLTEANPIVRILTSVFVPCQSAL